MPFGKKIIGAFLGLGARPRFHTFFTAKYLVSSGVLWAMFLRITIWLEDSYRPLRPACAYKLQEISFTVRFIWFLVVSYGPVVFYKSQVNRTVK